MPCDEGSEGLPGPGAQLCWRDAHHNQPVKAACRLVDRRARGESSESSHPTDENAAAKHLLTRQPALRSAGSSSLVPDWSMQTGAFMLTSAIKRPIHNLTPQPLSVAATSPDQNATFRQRKNLRFALRSALSLLPVPLRIDLDVLVPFLGKVFFGVDGLHRALVHAQTAVDAGVGIDVEHLRVFELGFIFGGVDAIHRADFDTGGVLGADARFGDDVRHWSVSS